MEIMTLRKELSEIKTDLKKAHEDLQNLVKENQKSTIQKYGEPVCKVARHLVSSGLGSICDVGVYGLNFVVEIVG